MKRTSFYWPFLVPVLFFFGNGPIAAQSVQDLQTSFDAATSKGDMKAAIPFAEKIMLVLEQQRIPDTTIYIKKLLQLSRTYLNASRSEEAEKCSLKALTIARSNDTQYADALIEWSASIGVQGEYERADSIAQLAIDLRRTLLGEDNIHYCGALLAAGAWQFQGGYTTKAINTLEECRSLWKKNNFDKPNGLVETLNYLGSCYYTVGKSTEAEMCFKEALAVRASFSGMNNHYFEDKIAFVEKSNLALILIDNGRYTEADEMLSTIESSLFEEGLWEDVAYSDIYALKAKLLSAVNKNEEAIAAAKKGKAMVIKAFGPNNPYIFQYDNLMGMDLIELGKPAEAIALYRTSLDSMKVLGGENWVEYAGMTAALPVCYINQHDYNTAIQLYLESLAYYESLGEGYELDLKQMYFGLVEAYMYTKNYAESAKYLEKFKRILVPDNSMDRGARILQAKLAYFGKNHTTVTPEVNHYVQALTKQISGEIFLFDDQKRQSQAKDLQSVTNDLCAFIQADAIQKKMPKLVEIALDFQLFTKSLLLTTTQKIRADILSGNDQTQKQSYAKWINQKEELAYYYTFPKAELVEQNIDLSQLEARADSLEKVLARNNAAYNNTTKNLATNWQTIRLALRPGEAALEIVRYQGQLQELSDEVHYAIFILSPERTEPVVMFIQDGEELEQVLLEKHLSACTSAQSTAPGSDLYNAVWKNIEPYVKNAKTIFVAADGCFHKINFSTLRQPDNTYLTDRYSFQPVFSLKDLLKAPGSAVPSRSAFLLGNPAFSTEKNADANTASRSRTIVTTDADTTNYAVYNPLGVLRDLNATRGIELKSLPGSQKEVDDLNALLQRNGWQTTLYTGIKAREEEVKSLRGPRIMHLATHGYFLANERAGTAGLSRETVVRNPLLRSMLFFAGAQNTLDRKPLDQKDDGILTAYEVQNMNLDSTELVVLSACKTGQGKVQNGEGVYGLQRALRIAGAQSLLLSLWDVDDEVGRTFMQTFYEQWLGGKSKHEAFRYTQLAIKAKYPHPFYWAGFILIGK